MKQFISNKTIFPVLVAVFGLLTWSSTGQAQSIGTLDSIERVHTVTLCGDNIREGNEECDHGSANGSEGDLCGQNCRWNIPEDQRECVEEAFRDCYRPSLDKLREAVAVENLETLEDADRVIEERVPADEDSKEDGFEACLEKALQECEPPEIPEEPQPEQPEESPVPEDKEQNTAPVALLEGSGCSLGTSASAAPNGLGILLGLGTFLAIRRRK